MKACSKFKIVTLFPGFFDSPLKGGLLGKAIAAGILNIDIIDLRAFSEQKHRRCDDYPYGGGSGMVLLPEPILKAVESCAGKQTRTILTTPGGRTLDQQMVKKLSGEEELCVICGQYEGVDQRIIDSVVDDEISIGDYILSGGEFAALVIIDAMARLVPGFMSNSDSLDLESFESDLLEYPQYTRPAALGGMEVPDVLLNGNHGEIAKWRHAKRIEKTNAIRPDLYIRYLTRKLTGE